VASRQTRWKCLELSAEHSNFRAVGNAVGSDLEEQSRKPRCSTSIDIIFPARPKTNSNVPAPADDYLGHRSTLHVQQRFRLGLCLDKVNQAVL